MEGYTGFPEADFDRHVDTFYPLAVDVLNRELGHDVRIALQNLLRRIGEVKGMGMGVKGGERRRALSMGLAGKPASIPVPAPVKQEEKKESEA